MIVGIVKKEGRARLGRTLPMPQEASALHPSWRIQDPLHHQKVTTGRQRPERDVKNEDRSGYVHENKWKHDKLSCQIADICAQLKPILQKITVLEGRPVVIGAR
jgi:hypothetical protein